MSALWAQAAEHQLDIVETLTDLHEHLGDDLPRALSPAAAKLNADRARTMQSLAAAGAIAYDELIARGGPDNVEAYEEYRLTVERNVALMPRNFGDVEPDT